jgi:hypothetical protein
MMNLHFLPFRPRRVEAPATKSQTRPGRDSQSRLSIEFVWPNSLSTVTGEEGIESRKIDG